MDASSLFRVVYDPSIVEHFTLSKLRIESKDALLRLSSNSPAAVDIWSYDILDKFTTLSRIERKRLLLDTFKANGIIT